jgi:hypothetical protein
MSARVAMNFDRVRAKQLLIEAGLPVARHRIAERPDDAWAFAREVGFPLAIDGVRVKSEGQLRGLLTHLHPRPERPVVCQESTDGPALAFQVMSIGGVPAWYSAVRTGESVILPREVDDPADATVRRMGFAALRALEMGSGIAEMKWFRRHDGSPVIAEVSARPPESHIMSLMGLAHGADMFRAWANAVVHGIFAPIPRLFAAGAARASADLETIRREPGVAVESFGGFVLVRHAETRVVESITRRLCSDRSGR